MNPEDDVSLVSGLMDKLHGCHQTVLAGEYQERTEGPVSGPETLSKWGQSVT
jgi:hypothetical protein